LKFRWQLVIYDVIVLALVDLLLLGVYRSIEDLSFYEALVQATLSFVCIFAARFVGGIYRLIWRYGGVQCYVRLLAVDGIAFVVNAILEFVLPIRHVIFARLLAISCLNLLGAISIRLFYCYAYRYANQSTFWGRTLKLLLRFFAGLGNENIIDVEAGKSKIAIIGAGRVGAALAEELMNNHGSVYRPMCFIDTSKVKTNRVIYGLPVLYEEEKTFEYLKQHEIEEVVFAIPNLGDEEKTKLYTFYLNAGYKVKTYDYPVMQSAGSKRYLREFDIEELLFRQQNMLQNDMTNAYYENKVILITGGGGSIGSELCRQLAKMKPKKIIILDIYENGAYDVQQELRITYGNQLNIVIEIASITNRRALEKILTIHRPQIVINAAAHKHVPLMEHNCIEAVENNVFGTKNLVDLCEEYAVERFMMVSTDKAVNPTNVMGATKRICEMIVQSASTYGTVKYSATRFGNVLGSAGSVVPLFKKQIANGGPVTVTDKRIIRYFMTIPEAARLVLESGAMAKNGELFVLDMGNPIKIYDLAENMIRLSGVKGIEIIETGLRPGEKLYEELLVKTKNLNQTENRKIFIEIDEPLDRAEIDEKLSLLRIACESNDDESVKMVLKKVVTTYKEPGEINDRVGI